MKSGRNVYAFLRMLLCGRDPKLGFAEGFESNASTIWWLRFYSMEHADYF